MWRTLTGARQKSTEVDSAMNSLPLSSDTIIWADISALVFLTWLVDDPYETTLGCTVLDFAARSGTIDVFVRCRTFRGCSERDCRSITDKFALDEEEESCKRRPLSVD